jgi:hypothetical protein
MKELKKLITLALKDGKISDKERELILKKASNLGIDEMEAVIVDCSIPESNIALGHASILYDIVKNKTPVSLILEDDIEFVPGFTDKLSNIFEEQLPDSF